MKLLQGSELVGYIKERQARQVRALRQAWHVAPRLAIVCTNSSPVTATYLKLKQAYGEDILVEVDVHNVTEQQAVDLITQLNADHAVHGIIVQLPLSDPDYTDQLVNAVDPQKDVDGLGQHPAHDPATPLAINWLLAGYNVDVAHKKIAVVGQGRLVGGPLTRMWQHSGFDVTPIDEHTSDLAAELKKVDIIVTATGVPRLITSDMIRPGSVVVDAGVATEGGKLVGDLDPAVYEREDLTITPTKGGVGPLTVCALFDNVIQSARQASQV